MYHQIILVGNLGQDPDMRYTAQGDAVTNFSVATNRRWTGKDGQPAEQTTWFRISVWGAQAEACNSYLQKGRQVLVIGEMSPDRESGNPRTWADQTGQVRASYEIRARTVQFLGGGAAAAPQTNGAPQTASATTHDATAPATGPIAEEEIPF